MIGNFLEQCFVFCFPSLLRDPTALHTVEPVYWCPMHLHSLLTPVTLGAHTREELTNPDPGKA